MNKRDHRYSRNLKVPLQEEHKLDVTHPDPQLCLYLDTYFVDTEIEIK